jgi:N-acetylmuramoyl-L-alanine amidase
VLAVRIGSRSAWYDGYQCLLGFAPRLINGLPYVHSLDALKMFQALARIGTPLPSPTRTIVLDPGHGGKDCGARSASDGGCEKDFALDWALRLRTLLEPRGWRVALTRSNDIFVPLAERVSLAERLGADVFLSFHFNSGDGNPRLAGLETFCLTPTGMPSSLQRDFEDDPAQKYPNNAFDEQNVRLAFALHRALLQRTGVGDRGVGRARFMSVLRGQNRPAVLIEAGYLSNPVEARKIATPEYRQLLAEAVLAGLE